MTRERPVTMATPWFRKHLALSLLIINVGVLALVLLVVEIVLRLVVPYNPGYYVSVSGNSREISYPYGTIKINSHGYPDDEFDRTKEHRVGYFGDSVTYGVGVGYGHRISELLESFYPAWDHLNFGGVGLSLSERDVDRFAELASEYSLDAAIYLFNLNDIIQTSAVTGEEKTLTVSLKSIVSDYLDWMRGRSYLYTYLRTKLKILLERRGIGFHGYEAYELSPRKNEHVLRETADRIAHLSDVLDSRGVQLTVVCLPYEMQISGEAALEYSRLGIHWEEGFLEGSTQEMMLALLPREVRWLDARFAFVDPGQRERSLTENRLGEFFVYDRGDKLDWNHPNRAGHRAIARFLAEKQILGPPSRTAGASSGDPTP